MPFPELLDGLVEATEHGDVPAGAPGVASWLNASLSYGHVFEQPSGPATPAPDAASPAEVRATEVNELRPLEDGADSVASCAAPVVTQSPTTIATVALAPATPGSSRKTTAQDEIRTTLAPPLEAPAATVVLPAPEPLDAPPAVTPLADPEPRSNPATVHAVAETPAPERPAAPWQGRAQVTATLDKPEPDPAKAQPATGESQAATRTPRAWVRSVQADSVAHPAAPRDLDVPRGSALPDSPKFEDPTQWTSSADTNPPTTTVPPPVASPAAPIDAVRPVRAWARTVTGEAPVAVVESAALPAADDWQPSVAPEMRGASQSSPVAIASVVRSSIAVDIPSRPAIPAAAPAALAAVPVPEAGAESATDQPVPQPAIGREPLRPKSPSKPRTGIPLESAPMEPSKEMRPSPATPVNAASIVTGSAGPVPTIDSVEVALPATEPKPDEKRSPQAPTATEASVLAPPDRPVRMSPRPQAPMPQAEMAIPQRATPSADFSGDGAPVQPMETAFTATLKPVDVAQDVKSATPRVDPQAPPPSSPATSRPHPAIPQAAGAPVAASESPAADDVARPAESSPKPEPGSRDKQPDAGQDRWRKPEEMSVSEAAVDSASRLSARPLEGRPVPGLEQERRPSAPEPAAPGARPQPEPPADPVKTAVARDIKLQVGAEGGDRVEVRVTERGGDVHVAVRTPDSRLAGELREDLPALATRLEQSGFKAETWHPAAAGEHTRPLDPQAGAASQDAQSQPRQDGGEQQNEQQQQRQRETENPDSSKPKEQGKDFEWLLSSLR